MSKFSPALTRITITTAFVFLVVGFAALAVELDLLVAGQKKLPIEFIIAAFVSAPALFIALRSRRRWMFLSYAVAWAAVAVFFLTPWHPRKQFVGDLFTVKSGMTVDQVADIMGRYEPRGDTTWTGPCPYGTNPGGPGDQLIAYAWNHTDGAYNADVGAITLEKGRVVNVEFWPD